MYAAVLSGKSQSSRGAAAAAAPQLYRPGTPQLNESVWEAVALSAPLTPATDAVVTSLYVAGQMVRPGLGGHCPRTSTV